MPRDALDDTEPAESHRDTGTDGCVIRRRPFLRGAAAPSLATAMVALAGCSILNQGESGASEVTITPPSGPAVTPGSVQFYTEIREALVELSQPWEQTATGATKEMVNSLRQELVDLLQPGIRDVLPGDNILTLIEVTVFTFQLLEQQQANFAREQVRADFKEIPSSKIEEYYNDLGYTISDVLDRPYYPLFTVLIQDLQKVGMNTSSETTETLQSDAETVHDLLKVFILPRVRKYLPSDSKRPNGDTAPKASLAQTLLLLNQIAQALANSSPAISTSKETIKTPTATLTSTPTPTPTESDQPESTKFYPEDGVRNDWFGYSIGVSDDGTIAVIGAWGDDPNGRRSGSAYIFSKSSGSWREETRISATDGDGGDTFGSSVDVSGDGTTALVGAPRDEAPDSEGTGSAYVFSSAGGSWTQEAKLIPEESDPSNFFAGDVKLTDDGTTALIGAPSLESPELGSAYVFSRSNGTWSQQTRLSALDGDANDHFGWSVDVSNDGTTALVSARNDEDPNGGSAGSAYVFSRARGSWDQETKLVPADGDSLARFGSSVGISGDGTAALVGARDAPNPDGERIGRAYVFSVTNGSWNFQTKLAPDDGAPGDQFGVSAELTSDGTIALVGAHFGGAAYMYTRANGNWRQKIKLVPTDDDDEDFFGWSLGLSRDATTALVGAPYDGDPNGLRSGSVYAFDM